MVEDFRKIYLKMFKKPEDACQMILNLQTEAKDLDGVTDVLFKINSTDSFEKNVVNLTKAAAGNKKRIGVKELRNTLAFLWATTVEDERVAMLQKSGLTKMIVVRLIQLMPRYCTLCSSDHYDERTAVPVITCVRCGTGACPTCYTREENPTLTKWKYLCEPCENVVVNDMGVGRLDAKDYDKNHDKVKSAQEPEKEGDKDKVENEEIPEIDLENDEELAKAASQIQGIQKKTDADKKNEALDKKKALDEKKKKAEESKKQTICPHLNKGRCHYGISGRKEVEGKTCLSNTSESVMLS